MSDLEYLPTKKEYTEYLQIADARTSPFSVPLNRIIVDLNKPQIIGNGGELSDLEYLPTKTEYIEYLQIVDTRTSRLFGPFK